MLIYLHHKTPGIDLIPTKLFKSDSEWESALLAPVFCRIYPMGKIPAHILIIPIFKEGD